MVRYIHKLFNIPETKSLSHYFSFLKVSRKKDRELIHSLLRNPFASSEDIKNLMEIIESDETSINEWIKGALGFFIFSFKAEEFMAAFNERKLDKAEKFKDEANKLLNLRVVKDFFFKEYQVQNEYYSSSLSLYRVGTTSFVIRIEKDLVLKLIKYKYIGHKPITNATQRYKKQFPKLSNHVPYVRISSEKYIIMDFVSGITLREYMEKYITSTEKDEILSKKNLIEIREIISKLCFILRKYAEQKICHNDLNPDNIIIQYDVDENPQPWIIDFGINYLVLERVGTASELVRTQTYISPELQKNLSTDSVKSDIFSLGIILAEMLCGKDLISNDIAYCLDSVWLKYPDFAKCIEQIIDREPKNRLFEYDDNSELYSILQEKLNSEFILFENVNYGRKPEWQKFLEILPVIVFGPFEIIFKIRRKLQAIRDIQKCDRETKFLLRWAVLTESLHTLILFTFIIFLLADLGLLNPIFEFIGTLEGIVKLIHNINYGDIRSNWPGRMIGLSFSIVATKYYLNIFSVISAINISKFTEFWLRFNSFCFSLPILWAIIYNPKDWPFCSALGVWFVALNNYNCYKLSKRAKAKIEESLELPQSLTTKHFLDDFGNWWSGMLGIGIGLFFAGIFFRLGRAQDEKIFAIITLVINLFILYRIPCTKKARPTRAGLERLFSGLDRVKRKQLINTVKKGYDPCADISQQH